MIDPLPVEGGSLLFDLTIHDVTLPNPRMETCGRPDCDRPTRYVLLRDNRIGYGICEPCIEDFDFWKERHAGE